MLGGRGNLRQWLFIIIRALTDALRGKLDCGLLDSRRGFAEGGGTRLVGLLGLVAMSGG